MKTERMFEYFVYKTITWFSIVKGRKTEVVRNNK